VNWSMSSINRDIWRQRAEAFKPTVADHD